MGIARGLGRLLSLGSLVWLERLGVHAHQRQIARQREWGGASVFNQPLRPDVRRSHRFQSGEDRP